MRPFSVLLVLSMAGCGTAASQSPPPPPPPAVVVGTPVVKPIVEWDEYVGRLEAVEFVEVRARVGGYLQSIHFDEGQIVREGDLLCVIDPRPFEAEVSRAAADLEEAKARVSEAKAAIVRVEAQRNSAEARQRLARSRLERSESLLARNAVSREEHDQRESEFSQARSAVNAAEAEIESAKAALLTAQAAVETAEAQLGLARLNLEYTEVHAPITGRVSRRIVTEGNLVSGGSEQATLLTTIVSLDPIHCYFDADEQAFLKYSRLAREGKRQSSRDVKNPVFVALADETNGYRHRGHMDFVDNRLDNSTGTMRARAILSNPENILTPGLFTRLRLPGSGRYEAVLIPDMAIASDQSEKFVYVIEADNKARRQPVATGPLVHGLRVVRTGLEGNERIVLRGLQRVRPGDEVTPTEEKITARTDDGLPDHYEPVPKEQWLTIPRRRLNGDRPYDDSKTESSQPKTPAPDSPKPDSPAEPASDTTPTTQG